MVQKPGNKFFDQIEKHTHPKFRIWVDQVRARSEEEAKVEGLRQLLPMGSESPEPIFIGWIAHG